ncbi:hypothetical protein BDV40DRAFT_54719 [Aspergillus tamarii]|uniref:Zn(2)-C6 fungal-type domain-containing protein n=1 Tax=Aspergillus tamarii TaxID=41984 RepID=A0A5N6UF87_ASPTM|nr:hypothetical protein BDV40DRAFT_54719 [Aspergillus tamarii]
MPNDTVPRRVTACDACYKRKIKCDRVGRQCNWCLHHDMSCTFSSDLRSKRRRQDSRYLYYTTALTSYKMIYDQP